MIKLQDINVPYKLIKICIKKSFKKNSSIQNNYINKHKNIKYLYQNKVKMIKILLETVND